MAKIRIYELAKELGTDSKQLESVVRGLGIEIKNYMSTLSVEEAHRVRQQVGGGASAPRPARKPTVRRRKGGGVRPAVKVREEAAAAAAAEAVDEPSTPAPAIRRSGAQARSAGTSTTVLGGASSAGNDSESHGANSRHAASARGESRTGAAHNLETRPSAGAGLAHAAHPDDAEANGGPAVGTVIQLPGGTRELPGGMRRRQAEREKTETDVPRSASAPRSAKASEPATPQPASPTPAREEDANRKVVRDKDGVIVGAAKSKAGPNIVGFVTLEPRPRKQQVIITDASQGQKRGRATARKQREERAQAKGRARGRAGARGNRRGERVGPKASSTVEMSDAKKKIRVDEAIQVSDLAHQLSIKASKVIRVLWGMGMRGVTINHSVDVETAEMVATEFGFTVENVSFDEEAIVESTEVIEGDLRAPVVTVMGHVDHGKTTLLDTIRKARVAAGEAGGITQHVSAYRVDTNEGPVVFIDTPGHAAFSAIRERGAQLTDIVVLIVAADDGVMPTTLEAIKYAQKSKVPIVVAINKIDKPDANAGRVKQMLMKEGLVGEEFGGDTTICEVSAKTGEGIEHLLELLALQAEVLDLRAPSDGRASGTVIESRIDKGRGSVSVVLVQSGTLQKGDILVANESSGKVRGVFSTTGDKLKTAGPSEPVEVLGLSGTPHGGDRFNVVENERAAKQLISHRRELRRRKESARAAPNIRDILKKGKVPTLKVVLRADVQGSAEALKQTLEELSVPDRVLVEVIFAGVGAINETDVKFAHAGDAVILGFNVKPAGKAAPVAAAEHIDIHLFTVIYEAADRVKELMVDLLEPEYREKDQGEAEVRQVFPIPRLGVVAGCRVTKGFVTRSSYVRVMREGQELFNGKIGSLRVFKDDVKEVKEGFECGIVVENFPGVEPGDVLESYELETLRPTL